jgi:hypothetical protein
LVLLMEELAWLILVRAFFFRFDFISGFFWLSRTVAMCLRSDAVSIFAITSKLSCQVITLRFFTNSFRTFWRACMAL